MAVLEGGTATISDCKFHINTATLFGGGVFIAHSVGQDTVLRRAELAKNSAGEEIASTYLSNAARSRPRLLYYCDAASSHHPCATCRRGRCIVDRSRSGGSLGRRGEIRQGVPQPLRLDH